MAAIQTHLGFLPARILDMKFGRVVAGAVLLTSAMLAAGCGAPKLNIDSLVNNNFCNTTLVGFSKYYGMWTVSVPNGDGTVRVVSLHLVPEHLSAGIRVLRLYAQAPNGAGQGTGVGAGSTVGGGIVTTKEIGGQDIPSFTRQVGLRSPIGLNIGSKPVTFAAVVRFEGLGYSEWKGLDVTYKAGGSVRTMLIPPLTALYGTRSAIRPGVIKQNLCPKAF
jgi:hypothetical protein